MDWHSRAHQVGDRTVSTPVVGLTALLPDTVRPCSGIGCTSAGGRPDRPKRAETIILAGTDSESETRCEMPT